MDRIDTLPEELIAEIYRNVFLDSLEAVKKMDTCTTCGTNLVLKNYMVGDYLCIACHQKLCLRCWHRCNNYGMGFRPFDKICQSCRNMPA